MAVVLETRDLRAGYGDLEIVRGVALEVRESEVVCVIGPNGAGKSTLLKALAGLVRPRPGSAVLLRGGDLAGLAPDRVAAAGLGYVPQIGNVFPALTVEENLEMGAFLRRGGVRESKERVYGLFPHLRERASQRVGKMSGGERQMVAIGRALMAEPRALVLDEPTANLSPGNRKLVFERVRAIAAGGVPVLMAEQNAREGLAASDRGYVLDQGRVKIEGRASEMLADKDLGKHYLGLAPGNGKAKEEEERERGAAEAGAPPS